MSILHEEKLKRIDDINKQYAISLEESENLRTLLFAALYQEMVIKQDGWEAFNKGESLNANPYKLGDEPDKSNHWKKGWEMARADAENETG